MDEYEYLDARGEEIALCFKHQGYDTLIIEYLIMFEFIEKLNYEAREDYAKTL